MSVEDNPVAVSFRSVDIIFGAEQTRALELLDKGGTREAILEETDAVLGVANASIDIHEGEIYVIARRRARAARRGEDSSLLPPSWGTASTGPLSLRSYPPTCATVWRAV